MLDLRNSVVQCLSVQPEVRLTAREIALWIADRFPEQCENKLRRSRALKTHSDLLQQIVAEIGAQRSHFQAKHSEMRVTEGRPRRYYWSLRTEEAAVAALEVASEAARTIGTTEADLYPLLRTYLADYRRVLSVRIDEKRSSNRQGAGGNRWLFPDVVGMEDLISGWHHEVRSALSEANATKARLWSFEVKLLLNGSNVRESYFQAVSNSSWANLGYLVSAEIEGGQTMDELRMLYGLHGIGVIRLDVANPAESEEIIPARERADVDWKSCNRLAVENTDFLRFIALVRKFHQTLDPGRAEWDMPRVQMAS